MNRTRTILVVLVLVAIAVIIGCAAQEALAPLPAAPSTMAVPPTIRIATFNIQVFGQAKLNKPEVMGRVVDIVDDYDIVAIQEIRSVEQNVVPTLVSLLGAETWDFRISERLGRTNSKEQYAFVFRRDRIAMGPCWVVEDPNDGLHREPFVCDCAAGRFDFLLVNIHTDPDEVDDEVNVLDDVLTAALSREGDAILLGDLNAAPSEFGELGKIVELGWVVPDGTPTNTRGTETYDNILFVVSEAKEFTGNGGVFDFADAYSLSLEEALDVSDHLPVWAEFRTTADLD